MRLAPKVWLVCAFALTAPLHAAEPLAVPVLWESPGCDHDKLGSVEIDAGSRVNEGTADINVPVVDYDRAVTKLANAGQAQGANAVVLRSHQGVYFTRNGKQSRKPVYVKLRGAAIHLAEPAQCKLVFVDVTELEARSRSGKPVDVSSRAAFEGE